MNYLSLLLSFILIPILGFSQQLRVVTELDKDIEETSGLIYLRGKLITHNDSGGEASLFEIDTVTGNADRIVGIENTTNVDWEDISSDEDYIYIGDFGNNYGTRQDLKIYRISIEEYFNSIDDIIDADIISFNYSDQLSFVPNQRTNFDAEALISVGDSLYIFTKNRGNFQCNVYSVPKTPGDYEISIKESFNSRGLITGASYSSLSNKIMLSGYTQTPFYIELSGYSNGSFTNGIIDRVQLFPPFGFSRQIESITFINEYSFFMSGEETDTEEETLYILDLDPILDINQVQSSILKVYPNPCSNYINIEFDQANIASFYDVNGKQILQSQEKIIDVSSLQKGTYFIRIKTPQGQLVSSRKVIIE